METALIVGVIRCCKNDHGVIGYGENHANADEELDLAGLIAESIDSLHRKVYALTHTK
jgi:hypothetical protein